MLILHIDWQEEPDATEILEILKKRILYNRKSEILIKNQKLLSDYEKSDKIYQLFPDDEGGVGVFCESTTDDYFQSIVDTSPRFDFGNAYDS